MRWAFKKPTQPHVNSIAWPHRLLRLAPCEFRRGHREVYTFYAPAVHLSSCHFRPYEPGPPPPSPGSLHYNLGISTISKASDISQAQPGYQPDVNTWVPGASSGFSSPIDTPSTPSSSLLFWVATLFITRRLVALPGFLRVFLSFDTKSSRV